MITLPESFWILFVIIIFCFIIKEAKNGVSHSLNPEKAKQELEDAKESLINHGLYVLPTANRDVWRSALNICTVYAKRL